VRHRARLETDVTYDAERAAQTIATPESVLPVVRTMTRRPLSFDYPCFCSQTMDLASHFAVPTVAVRIIF